MNSPNPVAMTDMPPFAIDEVLVPHPTSKGLRATDHVRLGVARLYVALSDERKTLSLESTIGAFAPDGSYSHSDMSITGSADEMIALGHLLMQAGTAAKALAMIKNPQPEPCE